MLEYKLQKIEEFETRTESFEENGNGIGESLFAVNQQTIEIKDDVSDGFEGFLLAIRGAIGGHLLGGVDSIVVRIHRGNGDTFRHFDLA